MPRGGAYHPGVLSPFLFWRPDRARLASIALQVIAVVVLAASAVAGVTALWSDLRLAYTWSAPSIFSEVDRKQMSAVREAVPPGATILVLAKWTDVWHARLWQRGLFPRNPVVVRLEPYGPEEIRKFRQRYASRYAVLIGPPAFDLGFRWRRDLGSLPGLASRVWFGELSP